MGAAGSHYHADESNAQWRQRHIGPVIGFACVEPLRVVNCGLKTIGIQGPDFRVMGETDLGDVRSKIRNYEANARMILRSHAHDPIPCRTY